MAKSRIVRLAERWTPDSDDPFGEDKRRLIRFLLENSITAMNPRPIGWILDNCGFVRIPAHCER
ncbi:MAG: hypothetical protein ACRD2X_00400 [Vicinamibacteraceae bacterium]